MGQAQKTIVTRRQFVGLGAGVLSGVLAGCAAGETTDATSDDTPQEMTVTPTHENVRLIGRTFERDGITWLPQSGSAVEFAATGSRILVELAGDENVGNAPDMRPRFAILVDGEVVLDDTLGKELRTIEVPLDGPVEGAVIEVMHLSEANQGWIDVRSITVESDAAVPVVPTAQKALSIAFIGDSITCAYGVEASGNDDPFKTTQENFMKSYAYLAAQDLEADYETACYSGYGIVSGWTPDGSRNESMLLPPVYDLVVEGHDAAWDFAAHPRDVVVINLGTNDFTYTGTDATRTKEFAQGYAAFLAHVREVNPESLIVCTLGSMLGCDALYPTLEKAVADYAERTGDARVMSYLSEPIDYEKEGCGTMGHPNEGSQRRIADALVSVIRQELGE
jgi:hypothetical protein